MTESRSRFHRVAEALAFVVGFPFYALGAAARVVAAVVRELRDGE